MQYEIFYSTVYPTIKTFFEANGIGISSEYRPATDFDGLDKFAVRPITIPTDHITIPISHTVVLSDINNCFEKLLKECNISYTKRLIDFRLPNWYEYELILD